MDINQLKNYILENFQQCIPENLSYHGMHHTLNVLEVCGQYIDRMGVGEPDANLLRTAALFHDLGFTRSYNNHEEHSVDIAQETLPGLGYSDDEIAVIAGIIRATKIPQQPTTVLEKIIGDSDLDYLGTTAFYETGETLFHELVANGKLSDREEWDRLQVQFLKSHRYHTAFAREHREPVKQLHLQQILDKWSWND
ncbi:HD domain-containing protein [Mangrovibacterium diazotrophicum]|uniref:Putative metal-dependent HD superfamily phosphohydrolase n=1 Tax=Mangrovibacterium diazotrophicum TaxID=1261403 RepID=A0A419W444_9BACT|nr:HD domain-containing protein [Mangrovibacterium diazotrophicum]RKD90217.1 putative metal-dependent HD superfamily phosphohydrolase [Mangrovibacterium diazotrophicum]